MAQTQCAVIGAGIVGISCGLSLLDKGFGVTLLDPEPPGSQTSSGNAGGFGFTDVMPLAGPGMLPRVPGWLLDPCGPLFIKPAHLPKLLPWLWRFYRAGAPANVEHSARALAALLEASEDDTRAAVAAAGLSDLFTEKGAITVYRSRESATKDQLEWAVKRSHGVEVVELPDAAAIAEREPELENAGFGYFTPAWCNTTDPHRYSVRLADHFTQRGGKLLAQRVQGIRPGADDIELTMDGNDRKRFDRVVIAAGAWSGQLCEQLGERVLLESERGYNTTIDDPGVSLAHQVIFGEEKFVISRINNGLRIGGAAEYAGLETPPNYRRSEVLVDIARRYLPGLRDEGARQWMGHRPSTPDSLPVIGRSHRHPGVIYAFGHGHYGLTMAATTGKLVAEIVADHPPALDLAPYDIARFN